MVPFAEGSTVLGEKDGGEPFPGETGTTPSWCGGAWGALAFSRAPLPWDDALPLGKGRTPMS